MQVVSLPAKVVVAGVKQESVVDFAFAVGRLNVRNVQQLILGGNANMMLQPY